MPKLTKALVKKFIKRPRKNQSESQGQYTEPNPVELPWYRTETSKVYGNPNGTYTAEAFLEPIHYYDGTNWIDIDNSLVTSSDG